MSVLRLSLWTGSASCGVKSCKGEAKSFFTNNCWSRVPRKAWGTWMKKMSHREGDRLSALSPFDASHFPPWALVFSYAHHIETVQVNLPNFSAVDIIECIPGGRD